RSADCADRAGRRVAHRPRNRWVYENVSSVGSPGSLAPFRRGEPLPRGAMLYHAYQAHCDAFAPVRLFAETARSWLGHAWPGIGDLPAVRGAAAAMDLISQAGMS